MHNKQSFITVKAGILQVVLVISLILAVLTSSVILFVYLQQNIISRQNLAQALKRNAFSGFNVALGDNTINYNNPLTFDLFENGNDSVTIIKKPWGLFDYFKCTATRGRNAFRLQAIIGAELDSMKHTALYVQDDRLPLSLAGKTYIQGKAYLPKAGVKRAYLNGADYEGEKLIYGETRISKAVLPALPDALTERIFYYTNGGFSAIEQNSHINDYGKGLHIVQSFDSATIIIQKPFIELSDIVLKGNVIVRATKAVLIKETAVLDGVLVIAPVIVLAEKVTGNAQFFASDTLIIKEGCRLAYPSVISVGSENNGYIRIDAGCRINGIVLLFNPDRETYSAQLGNSLEIAGESSITGYVYADALASIKGGIYGSLICRQFILNTSGSFYQNYLLNTTIDVAKRSRYFATSNLLSASETKKVIRWLP